MALKELLYWRDGPICPFTDLRFVTPGHHVVARSAHILPFSSYDKIFEHLTLSALTGRPIAEEVKNKINHPCNAFNAQTDARDTFDRLAWGIEAVHDGESVPGRSPVPSLSDRREIIFHRRHPDGKAIEAPNPSYCNMKLAIARAMHACGAADNNTQVNRLIDDCLVPFVSDEVLFRRVDDRLLTIENQPKKRRQLHPDIEMTISTVYPSR
ncbi:hypothetical protein PILCRDRAFT_7786 [Piloderma croceum F 1598]|uniref:HNH nuclease domain-containing protein n=1 Tax=Piloderma croceum (strain F 1598) TaxID=765440 RepID=A0A0C3B7U9_PILCF|nr:hypothetical protein PILCRDRAFT_7786 [Piloderma croceum F 1598]